MKEFKQNDKIELKVGGTITVGRKLGEGGQGVVYLVEMNGKPYALKWYTNECSQVFYDNLDNNIRMGTPTDSFLWPLFLTEWKEKRFGYLMALRPEAYKDFSHFLLAKVRFASLSAMTHAALQICNAFRELHRKGYSYQDLNDGNFFIHPTTGEVLICDNDNVAPYGKNLGIAGKCRYMAPEVVLRKSMPNADTDGFSLGILLFMLLINNHPLEGRLVAGQPCMTDQMEHRFYGSSPIFIFDPKNDSNRPVMGIHTNAIRRWPIFPQFIKDAFIHLFSAEGIHEPNKRNPVNEWRKLFLRLRDETVRCSCGNDTFLDVDATESNCVNCGKNLGKPLMLKVPQSRIVMFPGQFTYHFHTKSNSEDYTTQTSEVVRNPSNPALWGLKNLSGDTWICTMPNGTQKNILNKEIMIISKGNKLVFGGGIKGEIVG